MPTPGRARPGDRAADENGASLWRRAAGLSAHQLDLLRAQTGFARRLPLVGASTSAHGKPISSTAGRDGLPLRLCQVGTAAQITLSESAACSSSRARSCRHCAQYTPSTLSLFARAVDTDLHPPDAEAQAVDVRGRTVTAGVAPMRSARHGRRRASCWTTSRLFFRASASHIITIFLLPHQPAPARQHDSERACSSCSKNNTHAATLAPHDAATPRGRPRRAQRAVSSRQTRRQTAQWSTTTHIKSTIR